MYAEDLRRYDSCNGEAVEDVDERLPCLQVTPSFAFVVKAVDWGCQMNGVSFAPQCRTYLA